MIRSTGQLTGLSARLFVASGSAPRSKALHGALEPLDALEEWTDVYVDVIADPAADVGEELDRVGIGRRGGDGHAVAGLETSRRFGVESSEM